MTEFKARPTVYKGIQMRSRLEAGFAAWLDRWNLDWDYEPHAFASERGQYLPDFVIRRLHLVGIGRATAYVEVKRAGWLQLEAETTQWIAAVSVIWESDPHAAILLVVPDSEWVRLFHRSETEPFGTLHGKWALAERDGPDGPDEQAGIVFPIGAPWPDGYWKVS